MKIVNGIVVLNKKEQKKLDRIRKDYQKQIQPYIDDLRRSEQLTAEDFNIRINVKG